MEEKIQGLTISEERIKDILRASGLTVAEEAQSQ